MNTEIINIGNELLDGTTLNRHLYNMGKELFNRGYKLNYQSTVKDNEEDIINIFNIALNRSDIIFITGGLGPTLDDITRDCIAKSLGRELVFDQYQASIIEEKFENKFEMVESNFNQAYKIEGFKFIDNPNGTAPGLYGVVNNKYIVLLPGPPKELEVVFLYVLDELLPKLNPIIKKSIILEDLDESYVEYKIRPIIKAYNNFEISTYSHGKDIEIKITSLIGNDEIEDIYLKICSMFENNIKRNCYDREELFKTVVNILTKRNLHVGFAESCTAGLATYQIARVPGASNVLNRSFVTYSNEAKKEILNVKEESLLNYGAVSKEVAFEMSKGLLNYPEIDIGVSITGIAGPESDYSKKPIGLVYICVADKDGASIHKHFFKGNREIIQREAAKFSIRHLKDFLIKD